MGYVQSNSPFLKTKAKGGGTTKVCLPLAKIRSMSQEERQKVIHAKRYAAADGKRVKSSRRHVTSTRSKNRNEEVKHD